MSRHLSRIKSVFGLKKLPFKSDVGPDEFFLHPEFEKGLDRLMYVAQRGGIASVIAPIGVGKSTLIRAFIHDLGKTQFCPAYIPESTCSILDLYRAIAYAFDIEPAFTKVKLIKQIKDRLLGLSHSRKITPVLIIDEAHLLHRPFFDELRILLNFDADHSDHIMLLLAGQPQLRSSLRLSINEALDQRIIVRVKLSTFNRELTEAYLAHRLKLAGRTAPLFAPDAIEAIFTYSNGATRRIDRVCETALRIAAAAKSKQLNLDHINLAIEEMET